MFFFLAALGHVQLDDGIRPHLVVIPAEARRTSLRNRFHVCLLLLMFVHPMAAAIN